MSFILCSVHAAADETGINAPVTVSTKIDKQSITIGDRIKYTIEVKTRKGVDVQFPDFGENLAEFAIKDFGSSQGGFFGTKTLTQWYILDTYETGTFAIPGAIIKYRENDKEEWKEVITEKKRVEVKSVFDGRIEEADIKDIKGPVRFQNWTYIYIIVAVLAAIIIVVLAILFIRKRKKSKVSVSPPRPAHEIAFEALRNLMSKDYLKTGRVREYYFELSDIVRHYVENRFCLKAPEMTTEEFLATLRNSDVLSSGQKSTMREFLSHCDMVKFAKYHPQENEVESSYESAKKFIDRTKESVVEKAGA